LKKSFFCSTILSMRIVVTGSHGVGKTTLCKLIQEELNMRMGVTGSHGTGKTTVSKYLAGKGGYHYLPEAPFQAFQSGFAMNEGSGLDTEIWIFGKQAEMEKRHEDNWIADKCFIDLLAYARYLFREDSHLLHVLERVARPYIERYQHVIYLPTGEFPIEDDGFRSLDPEFQQAIDGEIVAIMEEMRIPFTRVTGSVPERFEKIMAVIGR